MGLLEDIGQALYQTYSVGPNQAIDQVSNQLASLLSNIPAEKWVSGEQEAARRIGEVRGKQTAPQDVGQLATLGGMLGSYANSASPIFGLEGLQKAAADISPALGATAEIATDPLTYLGGGGKAAAGVGVKTAAELPALLALIGSKLENPKNWKVAQTLAELFTKEVPIAEKIAAQDVELLKKFANEKELAKINDLISKLPTTPAVAAQPVKEVATRGMKVPKSVYTAFNETPLENTIGDALAKAQQQTQKPVTSVTELLKQNVPVDRTSSYMKIPEPVIPEPVKPLTELEILQQKINEAGKRFAKSGEAITPVNKAGTTISERYVNPEVRQDIAKQVMESRAVPEAQQKNVAQTLYVGEPTKRLFPKEPISPVTPEQAGEAFVKKMQTPAFQTIIEPSKLEKIRAYINANPVKSLIGAATGAGTVGALPNLLVGRYTPQTQAMQPVGANNAQTQSNFAKGFAPGVAANQLVNQLQQQQQQAVGGSANATGQSPQDILMKIAQAILMNGGGGASIEQIADLIYKSGALGQQDKYREAQIKEMGTREARTNAAIQISRQAIEEPYQNAIRLAEMNPKDDKLAEAAKKAREERDRKLAEFDQRVFGAQQSGAQ